MLTIFAFEEEPHSPKSLNKTETTGISEILTSNSAEQKEADEYIKQKIKRILSKDDEKLEASEMGSGALSSITQRRSRRNFWKNVMTYLSSYGYLGLHVMGVVSIKFFSYYMISNQDILKRK